MDWKNILRIDGFKVFLTLIFNLFPQYSQITQGNTAIGKEIMFGFPICFFKLSVGDGGIVSISGATGAGFVVNIAVAYIIGVGIASIYYFIKK